MVVVGVAVAVVVVVVVAVAVGVAVVVGVVVVGGVVVAVGVGVAVAVVAVVAVGAVVVTSRSVVPDLVSLAVDEGVAPEGRGKTSGAARAGSVIKAWIRRGASEEDCRILILGLGWMRRQGQPVTVLLLHGTSDQVRGATARAREAYHDRRKQEVEPSPKRAAEPTAVVGIADVLQGMSIPGRAHG